MQDATATEHNAGNTDSKFSSWSTCSRVAGYFSAPLNESEQGYFITSLMPTNVEFIEDDYHESEVLVIGKIKGCYVYSSKLMSCNLDKNEEEDPLAFKKHIETGIGIVECTPLEESKDRAARTIQRSWSANKENYMSNKTINNKSNTPLAPKKKERIRLINKAMARSKTLSHNQTQARMGEFH